MGGLAAQHPAAMVSGNSAVLDKLKALDAFPKINEDFFSRTASGGIITLASSFIMLLLFTSELSACCRLMHCCWLLLLSSCALGDALVLGWAACRGTSLLRGTSLITSPHTRTLCAGDYYRVQEVDELSVDTSRGEQMQINVSERLFAWIAGNSRGPVNTARSRLVGTQGHSVSATRCLFARAVDAPLVWRTLRRF